MLLELTAWLIVFMPALVYVAIVETRNVLVARPIKNTTNSSWADHVYEPPPLPKLADVQRVLLVMNDAEQSSFDIPARDWQGVYLALFSKDVDPWGSFWRYGFTLHIVADNGSCSVSTAPTWPIKSGYQLSCIPAGATASRSIGGSIWQLHRILKTALTQQGVTHDAWVFPNERSTELRRILNRDVSASNETDY